MVAVDLMKKRCAQGVCANDLRRGHFGGQSWAFPLAGFHCSWCFGDNSFAIKADSFSHHEVSKMLRDGPSVSARKCSGIFMGAKQAVGVRERFAATGAPRYAIGGIIVDEQDRELPLIFAQRPSTFEYLLSPPGRC